MSFQLLTIQRQNLFFGAPFFKPPQKILTPKIFREPILVSLTWVPNLFVFYFLVHFRLYKFKSWYFTSTVFYSIWPYGRIKWIWTCYGKTCQPSREITFLNVFCITSSDSFNLTIWPNWVKYCICRKSLSQLKSFFSLLCSRSFYWITLENRIRAISYWTMFEALLKTI
jgi:hypothetical protein